MKRFAGKILDAVYRAGERPPPKPIDRAIARVWFAAHRPGVAVLLCLCAFGGTFTISRFAGPWVPLVAHLRVAVAMTCPLLAGVLYLVVLAKLLHIREGRLACLCVALPAMVLTPFFLLESSAMCEGTLGVSDGGWAGVIAGYRLLGVGRLLELCLFLLPAGVAILAVMLLPMGSGIRKRYPPRR